MKPKKILVLCLRYLGDSLLTRPVLRALHQHYPEAKISVLIMPGTEVALENFSYPVQVLTWPRSIIKQIHQLITIFSQGYDLTLDLTGNDRTALLTFLSRAEIKMGYEKPNSWWSRLRSRVYNVRVTHEKIKPHILFQHQKLLEAYHIPFQGTSLELKFSQSAQEKIISLLSPDQGKKIILAHLTSRDMQKSLPIVLVREVILQLIKQNSVVVLTHGTASTEKEYAMKCAQGFSSSFLKIMPVLTWDELIALISQADIYWGVDTAPTHLASDLQKPMLVHYGPSNATQWHPLNPKAETIISPCACLKMKQCPEGVSGECFTSLSSLQIISTLEKLIKHSA